MLALPPLGLPTGWRSSLRLPRDHYVRFDTNDYSMHPGAIGRRVEVIAGLDRVQVLCDGRPVADHPRCWARHQSVHDPADVAAAHLLRAQHAPSRAPGRAGRRPPGRVGLTAMVVLCVLVGGVFGWLRLRSGSVWPAALAHAAFDAAGGSSLLFAAAGERVDTTQATVLGWSGWIVLVVVLVATGQLAPAEFLGEPSGKH